MNNLNVNYGNYQTLDFFSDENFIQHVLHPDEVSVTQWAEVLANHPGKAEMLEEAGSWIRMLHRQQTYQSPFNNEHSWEKISGRIEKYNYKERKYIIPLKRAVKWTSGIAAMLIVYFGLAELMQQGKQVFKSDYGELMTVGFPDESVAILNGNSKVYYVRDWRSDKPRELWMEGEASFKVKHVAIKNRFQQADSFRVHVNGLELTVLGTRFNVKNRRGQTEISLIEGSLRIDRKGQNSFSKYMKPGDVLLYNGRQLVNAPIQRTVHANQSWTGKELVLDGYTLGDIIALLEDTYGYQVKMDVPELADKKMRGVVPLNSPEDVLFVIEKVFDLKIIKNKNQLLITH